MTDYISVDDLREYIGSDTTNFQDHAQACVTSASRMVERTCDRIFTDTGSTSTRHYEPDNYIQVHTHDFSTTTGLIVAIDASYDGTYATTLTINQDFQVEPIDGIDYAGRVQPYNVLHIVGVNTTHNSYFPPAIVGRKYTVQVTARWGWASVPDEIVHATKIAAAWLFKQKDAADGFIGLDGWGPRFYKDNPSIKALITPYMRDAIAVG